jgi:hypothetical protein
VEGLRNDEPEVMGFIDKTVQDGGDSLNSRSSKSIGQESRDLPEKTTTNPVQSCLVGST